MRMPWGPARSGYGFIEAGRRQGWVAASTQSDSDTGTSGRGYGYLWWVRTGSHSFSANGHEGQTMIVNPARDLIFVHLVDTDHGSGRKVSGSQLTSLLQLVMDARN